MRLLRRFACVDCGAPTERWRTAIEPKICVDCGVDRAVAAMVQMHNRQGPYWDRFILAQQRRAAARTPTTVE